MALYGKSDAASNVSVAVCSSVQASPTTSNRAALYGNTTANAFVSGATKGVFGVSVGEAQTARAGDGTRVSSPGYQLRTVGSGGRAGRVQNETLAAVRITTDAEDVVFANYKLVINTQPSSASGSASGNQVVSFAVGAGSTPSGAVIDYIWQKYNGSAFANLTNTGAYGGTTTATLTVNANTAANGEIYRARVSSSSGGAKTVYTSNAVITVAS